MQYKIDYVKAERILFTGNSVLPSPEIRPAKLSPLVSELNLRRLAYRRESGNRSRLKLGVHPYASGAQYL